MTDDASRHEDPKRTRNDKYGFDKYHWPADSRWPSGLEMTIYDDGRVKVGGWHTSAVVLDVSSYRTGSTNASGHVVVQFQPTSDQDHDHGEDHDGTEKQ